MVMLTYLGISIFIIAILGIVFRKQIFEEYPSVQTPDRRWGLFAIVLSITALCISVTVSWIPLKETTGGELLFILGLFFAVLAVFGIGYMIFLSAYWRKHPNTSEEVLRNLDKDIQDLKNRTKQIETNLSQLSELPKITKLLEEIKNNLQK
jgi:hypothetical protein